MNRTSFIKKLSLVLGLFVCVSVGIGVGYYFLKSQPTVYDFNEEHDTQPILDIFKHNWYWLVSSADYSPEFMLKNRAPNNKNPEYFGQLQIKVIRQHDDFIGFITYYMKAPQEGFILFVAVKQEYRGQRYAAQLMRYAIDEMKRKGARVIKLVTRPSNLPAQSLYKRIGFKETYKDDEYVFFSYYVK